MDRRSCPTTAGRGRHAPLVNRLTVSLAFVVVALSASRLAAQPSRFEVGGQLATVISSEFDAGALGVGARFSWHPTALVGTEAEVGFYPADFPRKIAFSRSQVEGLFGVTLGPRLGLMRPFGKLRPGFVTFHEAPFPIACLLIFPQPLSCALASGKTVFALDVGGGLEFFPDDHAFVRFDIGDRSVRYPAPVLDGTKTLRERAFFSHDFRFALGGGVRF
jgi:hypothetical protein